MRYELSKATYFSPGGNATCSMLVRGNLLLFSQRTTPQLYASIRVSYFLDFLRLYGSHSNGSEMVVAWHEIFLDHLLVEFICVCGAGWINCRNLLIGFPPWVQTENSTLEVWFLNLSVHGQVPYECGNVNGHLGVFYSRSCLRQDFSSVSCIYAMLRNCSHAMNLKRLCIYGDAAAMKPCKFSSIQRTFPRNVLV